MLLLRKILTRLKELVQKLSEQLNIKLDECTFKIDIALFDNKVYAVTESKFLIVIRDRLFLNFCILYNNHYTPSFENSYRSAVKANLSYKTRDNLK